MLAIGGDVARIAKKETIPLVFLSSDNHIGRKGAYRQIRKASAAWIVHIVRLLLWTICGDLIQPINDLAIAATIINQSLHGVASYGNREDDAPHEGAFR
jgi:hypothetical protein